MNTGQNRMSKKPGPNAGNRKYTPAQIIKAIEGTGGIIAQAIIRASKIHPDGQMMSRETFLRYKNEYPEIAKALEDAKEATLDLAESKLMSLVSKEDLGAICFYLKTQGKRRGYIERQELDHGGKVGIEGKIHFDAKAMTDEQLQEVAGGKK
jgi:hypothetical protein